MPRMVDLDISRYSKSLRKRIKQFGQFVMLMPRALAAGGESGGNGVPLPKSRPKDIVAAAH